MNTIVRQHIPANTLRQVSTSAVRRSLLLQRYVSDDNPSKSFSITQLYAVFCSVLSESILLPFLKANCALTLKVIAAIIEDHERENTRALKDLQVNLLANLIVQHVRTDNVPLASRYGVADTWVRKCELSPEFKLAVRKALFDRQSIQCDTIMIHPFQL